MAPVRLSCSVRSAAHGLKFACLSPLEGAGFEPSVPRPWRAQLARRGIGRYAAEYDFRGETLRFTNATGDAKARKLAAR